MVKTELQSIDSELRRNGFVFLPQIRSTRLLGTAGSMTGWERFAASWNDLPVDMYMSDGGRYRRRRHGVYSICGDGTIRRGVHQPHYQGLDDNSLNGGIERWFEPLSDDVAVGQCLQTILKFCHDRFRSLSPDVMNWHVEVHQFRIEATLSEQGLPTPEGMHRDGVDYVLVLLVARSNIARGTTLIAGLDRQRLGSFTLTDPLDAALVDDKRVFHGVTAVEPVDHALPAYRDVLVVTFRQEAQMAELR